MKHEKEQRVHDRRDQEHEKGRIEIDAWTAQDLDGQQEAARLLVNQVVEYDGNDEALAFKSIWAEQSKDWMEIRVQFWA